MSNSALTSLVPEAPTSRHEERIEVRPLTTPRFKVSKKVLLVAAKAL